MLCMVRLDAQKDINIANKNYKFSMILSIFNAILTIFYNKSGLVVHFYL